MKRIVKRFQEQCVADQNGMWKKTLQKYHNIQRQVNIAQYMSVRK